MNQIVVISGFLGAGKTTLLLRLAKQLAESGKKVALITNDKGSVLVDTEYLKTSGLPVHSVSGGCFCTHLDLLEGVLDEIKTNLLPDIILAEPIGSCIDILATILLPIYEKYAEQFAVAPLTTVIDPARLMKYMQRRGSAAQTHLDYVFSKQMEQADVLFLNKCDQLCEDEIASLAQRLQALYPDKRIITGSANSGAGCDALLESVLGQRWQQWSVDIDKGIHRQAEKALGWYSVAYRAKYVSSAQKLLQEIGEQIVSRFPQRDIAHLKLLAISESKALKVSFTQNGGRAGVSGDADMPSDFLLILNARIEASVAEISSVTFAAVEGAKRKHRASLTKTSAPS